VDASKDPLLVGSESLGGSPDGTGSLDGSLGRLEGCPSRRPLDDGSLDGTVGLRPVAFETLDGPEGSTLFAISGKT
jgi:hypothetical protein